LYKACKENDINTVQKCLDSIDIETINQRVSNGNTALHIASYYGYNEIVQLLLDTGASRSIRNIAHGLTPYEEARSQDTKDLFRYKNDNSDQHPFISDNLYIEWISTYREPSKKRNHLRHKLFQFLSLHDNDDRNMFKFIGAHINFYIDSLDLSNCDKAIVKQHFSKFLEIADPVYIIKAYSSTTSFHRHLNEHIARYGIDFFDPFIVDINVDYRMVKCVLEIVAIVMHHERFHEFRYCGKTYRGMLMIEEDLYKYIVGSKVMNKAFLSTSKRREIANAFSGNEQEKFLRKTPDKQPIHIAALCTYIIKNSGTALDIETISERICDEKEVLILPFSAFTVKSVLRLSSNVVEMELEEIIDDEMAIDELL
jgi:hypothetical protein